ncbi:MAG: LysM peptidoglycan-binding domain-containing protein [Candidatus Omnitrophota bacterium]|jgi:nucleoid-associated protein YgaU
MSRKISLLVLLCFLSLIINGCTVRSYKVDKQRVDQDLSSGNRGVLFGEPKVTDEARKPTRVMQVIEFELPADTSQEAAAVTHRGAVVGTPDSTAPVVLESAQQPSVVVGPAESTTLITMKEYTVREGDTLQKISQKFYGTTKRWNEIYKANQAVLKAADQIYPGQVIKIPLKETIGK